MKPIDDHDKTRLTRAAEKMAALVDRDGLTPTEALVKVSRDENLTPGWIRTVGYAYNTARQLEQHETAKSTLDKLASFDLADPDAAIEQAYPPRDNTKAASLRADLGTTAWFDRVEASRQAAATLSALDRLAPLTKLASAEPPTPYRDERAVEKAMWGIRDAKRAHEDLRGKASACRDKLAHEVAQLVIYFKKRANERLPLDVVEYACRNSFGSAVTPLFDLVHHQAGLNGSSRYDAKEKRAGDLPPLLGHGLNRQAPPFTFVDRAVKLAEQLAAYQAALTDSAGTVEKQAEECLAPFVATGVPISSSCFVDSQRLAGEKNAFMGGAAMGATMGGMLGRGLGDMPKTKNDLIEDAWLDLESPDHQNEIRRIKAETMLTSLMTDPDEPISAHARRNPDAVLRHYNEIAQMAPRTAEQPAALRPVLRSRLEGNPATFEAKELTDIEKGLAASRLPTPNTSVLGEAPDKLLG